MLKRSASTRRQVLKGVEKIRDLQLKERVLRKELADRRLLVSQTERKLAKLRLSQAQTESNALTTVMGFMRSTFEPAHPILRSKPPKYSKRSKRGLKRG